MLKCDIRYAFQFPTLLCDTYCEIWGFCCYSNTHIFWQHLLSSDRPHRDAYALLFPHIPTSWHLRMHKCDFKSKVILILPIKAWSKPNTPQSFFTTSWKVTFWHSFSILQSLSLDTIYFQILRWDSSPFCPFCAFQPCLYHKVKLQSLLQL